MKQTLLYIILLSSMFACSQTNSQDQKEKIGMKELSDEEKYVMLEKGTERPFTGAYYNHKEDGVYTCKQCGSPLFKSDAKFNSGTGWPSFDDAVEGAVEEVPDADGRRTEIVCANCKAHLGHVFKGEGFTGKNTRHCVNSICLNFESQDAESAVNTDTAIFASGCFWGTEYWFEKQKGVLSTEVGYTGGHVENPGYKQVCTGTTGHAEAVRVIFNPDVVSYDELVKLFFETHDPEQVNRQGPDIGEQYRSEIFYFDNEQKKIAERYRDILINKGFDIATAVTKAGTFYTAEDYHKKYYSSRGTSPYCHVYTKRF